MKKSVFKRLISGFMALVIFISASPADLSVFSVIDPVFGIYNNFSCLAEHSDNMTLYTLKFYADDLDHPVMEDVKNSSDQTKYKLVYTSNKESVLDENDEEQFVFADTVPDAPDGQEYVAVQVQSVYDSGYLAGMPFYEQNEITLPTYYEFTFGTEKTYLESNGHVLLHPQEKLDFTANTDLMTFLRDNHVRSIDIKYDPENEALLYSSVLDSSQATGNTETQQCYVKFSGDDFVTSDHEVNTFTSTDYLDYEVSLKWNDDGGSRPDVKDMSFTLKRKAFSSGDTPPSCTNAEYDQASSYESGGVLEGYDDFPVSDKNTEKLNSNENLIHFRVPAHSCNGNTYDYIAYRGDRDNALPNTEDDRTPGDYRSERTGKNSFDYTSLTDFECELDFLDSARSDESLLDRLKAMSPADLLAFVNEHFELKVGSGTITISSGSVSVETDASGISHLVISGLDAIDSNSNTLNYYLQQKTSDTIDFSGDTTDTDYYAVTAKNDGLNSNEVTKIYNGSKAVFLLTGETTFEGTLNWVDNATKADRLEKQSRNNYVSSFVLWRYVNDLNVPAEDRADMKAQAGNFNVYGGYKDEHGENQNQTTFAYADSSGNVVDLPKYDLQGREYIYYAKESETKLSGYEISSSKNGPVADSIGNGATLTYSLSGTVNYVVDAKWIAASLQGGTGEIKYELERFDGTDWVSVPYTTDSISHSKSELTIDGFSAELMEKDLPFYTDEDTPPDKYDTSGDLQIYRIVQKSIKRNDSGDSSAPTVQDIALSVNTTTGKFNTVTLNGRKQILFDSTSDNNVVIKDAGDNIADTYFKQTIGGRRYKVRAFEGNGNNKNTVYFEYTLVDTINLKVDKDWANLPKSNFKNAWNAKIGLQLMIFDYKTGNYINYNTSAGNPGDITYQKNSSTKSFSSDGSITVESSDKVGDDRFSVLLENVPQYDDEGHLNRFKVVEPASYPGSSQNSTKITTAEPNEVIVTNYFKGSGERLELFKVWMDDGEAEYKSNVGIEASGRVMRLPMNTSDSNEEEVNIDLISDEAAAALLAESYTPVSEEDEFSFPAVWTFNGYWNDFVTDNGKYGTKNNDGTGENVYPMDISDYLTNPTAEQIDKFDKQNTKMGNAITGKMSRFSEILDEGNIYHISVPVRDGYTKINASDPSDHYYRLKDFREYLTSSNVEGNTQQFYPTYAENDLSSDVQQTAVSALGISGSPILSSRIDSTVEAEVTSGTAGYTDIARMSGVDYSYKSGDGTVDPVNFEWLAGIYEAKYKNGTYTRYYAVQEVPEYDLDGSGNPTRLRSITFKNTRVGVISYKVNFDWKVGSALSEHLIKTINMKIEADYGDGVYHEIDFNGNNYVPINVTENLSEYYILNLPKYASNGRIINYRLSQISVVDNNDALHPVTGTGTRTWQTSAGDNCVVTMTKDPHEINTASNTDDIYPITITNTFKDDEHIRIYKQWIDDSNALNTRSDLYIRLYRKDHNNTVIKSPTDYYWNPEQTNHWTYEFPAKPKYDELGYRYTYYVDEITTDLAKADYVTKYYGDYGLSTQESHDHAYNGDTIENKLEGTVTINGTKMWQYVSETLRNENYPIADVFLYKETKLQTGDVSYTETMSNDTYDGNTSYVLIDTDSSKHTNIELVNIRQIRSGEKTFNFTDGYSLPIDKTAGTVSNGGESNYNTYGNYIFTGSAASLPKYDEYGARINYFMDERTINGYKSTVNDQSLTNEYTGGDKFKITFNKTWQNMNNATGKSYPTLEVTLHQAYLGYDGSGVKLIDYKTFTPPTPFYPNANGENDYSYTFGVRENLRMYAPTGEKFYYYFTERMIDEQRSDHFDFANTYIAVSENDPRISDTTHYTMVYPESGSVSVATNSSGGTGKYVLLKQNTVNKGLGFICEIGEISGSTVNGEYTEKTGSVTNSYEPDENNFKGKLVVNKNWENYNKTTQNKANDEYENYENYRFTVSRYTRSLSPAKNIFQIVTGGSSATDPNMPELVLGAGLKHSDFTINNPGFFRYKDGVKVTSYEADSNDYDYYKCELTFTKAAYTTFSPITVTITVYPAGTDKNKKVEIEGLAIYGQDGVGYTYTINEVAASAYKASPETQSKQMGKDDTIANTLSYDLTNELNTFTLRLNKVFGKKYKNSSDVDTYEKLDPADYSQFFNAAFVNKLKFKIQRKDPGGSDWYDYDYKSWNIIDSSHKKGVIRGSELTLGENGYYYDFKYLPKYKPVDDRLTSSDNAYQYRIIELNDWDATAPDQHVWKYYPTGVDDVSVTNSTDANAQAVTPIAETTFANVYVRNVFEAKNIRLDKFWFDNENADGLRGDYLPVIVKEKITGQSDVAINRTLKASDSWTMQIRLPRYYYNGLAPIDGLSFTIDEAALSTVYQHEDENNRGNTLSELGYSKKETGYEKSDGSGGYTKETDSIGSTANSTSQDSFIGLYIDNQKTKVNSRYTFKKSWDDFNNKWLLRPGNIYVKLLRKPEGESTYSVVTLQNDGSTTIDPVVDGTHCTVNTTNGVITIARKEQTVDTNKDIDMTIDNLDYGANTGGGDQSNGTWKQYLYTIVECDQYGNDIQAPFTYSESSSGTQEIAKNIDVDINISALEQDGDHRARHIHIKLLDESDNLITSDVYGNPIKVTCGKEVFYSGASSEFVKEGIILLSVPEDEAVTTMHIKIWNLPVKTSYTIKRCKRDGADSSDEGNITYEHQTLSSVNKPSGTTFSFSKTWGENSSNQTLRPDKVYFKLYRRFESDSADSSSALTIDKTSNFLQASVKGLICTSEDGLFTIPVDSTTLSGNTLSGTVSGLDYGAFDDGVYKKYTYYAVECGSDGTALSTGNTYTWAFDNEGADKDKPFVLSKDSTGVYSEAELTEGITNTLRKDNHNLTTTWEDGSDQSARTSYFVKLQRRAGEMGAWEDVTLTSDGGNVFLSDNTEITNIASNVVTLQPTQLNVSFKDLPEYDGSGIKYQYRVTETKIGGNDVTNGKRYLFHIANDTSYVLGWYIRGTNNYYVDHGYDEMGYSFDCKTSTITNTLVINPVSYVHVKASKVWDDENNLYGKRPSEITYKLTRTKTTVSIDPDTGNITTTGPEPDPGYCLYTTVTEKDKWETTWTRCAAFSDEGVEYNYIVSEVVTDETFKGKTYKGLPAGYDLNSTTPGSDVVEGELVKTFEFTNKYKPDKKSLTAMKDWADQSDLFSLRPSNVTYTLYCSYEIWDYDRDGSGKVVTDSNGNPQGLSKRGDYGTNLGDFTGDVVYSPAVGTPGDEGYVAEKRSKVFDSIRIEKPSADFNDVIKTLTKDANHLQLSESPDTYDDDKWTETFSNLPTWVNTCGDGTYAGHASPVTYYIVESFTDTATTDKVKITYECGTDNSLHSSGVTLISTDGKSAVARTDVTGSTAETSDDGVTITNSLRTHDVIVTNTWDDQGCTEDNSDNHLHSNISVTLSSSNFTESGSSFSRNGVIDKLSDKVLVFRALPKYDTEGDLVTYSISEKFTIDSATEESASAKVSYQAVEGITAPFNQQTGAVDATEFTQNKDNSGKQKYGYEASCEKSTVTEIEGKPIVERYDITNQLPVTTVNVTKNWNDNYSSKENYYDLRPGTINMQLYRTTKASPVRDESNTSSVNSEEASKWITVDINGSTEGTKKAETTDKDSASTVYPYEKLLRYSENNTEYCFMVKEDAVPAYETTYPAPAEITSSGETKSLSVTNTLSVRPIVVAKKWENGGFGDSLQYNVKVTLSSTGLKVGGTDATATYSDNQIIPKNASKSAAFANLPIYDKNGAVITYSVKEEYTTDSATATSGTAFDNTAADTATEFVWSQKDSRYGYKGNCTKTVSGTGTGAYVTQYNITNELPLSTITVTKQWDDKFNDVNNYYNIRPDSVTLGLYRTTGSYPHSTTAGSDEATGWVAVDGNSDVSFGDNNTGRPPTKDYVFNNIQRYSFDNTEYKFEVIEKHVNGYTVTYDPDSTTGVTATDTSTANPVARTLKLKNSLDTRDITVTKSWQDNDYSGGASLHYNTNITLSSIGLDCGITSTAYSDSKIIASASNNNHGVVFEHLPKYDAAGDEIAYTVAEEPTDTAATVSSEKSRTATENAESKLTVSDRHYGYSGSMKEKRISESVNGASKSYTSQFDITNSLPVITITSESLWNDDNNRDGKRPASVTVTLKKTYDNSGSPVEEAAGTKSAQKPDESKTGEALTAELASCWTADFGAQPKYAVNNNPYTYSVSHPAPTDYTNRPSPELTIPASSSSPYSTSDTQEHVSGVKEFKPSDSPTVNLFVTKRENDDSAEDTDGTIKFTVLNQYTPKYETLNIKKTWNDAEFRSFVRPGSISVDLSVGYYPQDDHDNAYMSVTKLSSVTADKLTNLGLDPSTYGTVSINGTASGTEWNYNYSSAFPLRTNPTGTRKINGTSYDIKYQIDENDTNLIGYTKPKSTDSGFLSISGTNTLELENTLRTTDLTLKKVWDNNGYTGTDFSHFGVTVRLSAIAPVSGGSDITIGASTRLNDDYVIPAGAANVLENTIPVNNVPLYDKDGHKIQYSISELNSLSETAENLLIMHSYGNFKPTDSLFAADHESDAVLTVGNRLPLAAITVKKTWADQENIFGLRKDITLSLYRTIADRDAVGNKKGDANFHIADTSNSETEADGWVLVETKTFPQSTSPTMDCTFDHILRYDDGNHEYRFTVLEDKTALQAYDASYADPVAGTGENDGTTTQAITNTLKTHDVSVSKSWANEYGCLDALNSSETDNLRYNVDITLSSAVDCTAADRRDSTGKYKETKTIAKNAGPVTFSALPVCDNTGTNFTYTPAEKVTGSELANRYGYTPAFAPTSLTDISSASSIALTNTLQKTSVTVTKSWSDDNDKFHLRPTSITLKLYRTTSASLAQSGTLSTGANRNMTDEGSKWVYVDEFEITGINHSTHSYSHTFSDLLMYNQDNQPYYFMVREEHVNGYVTTYPVSKSTTSEKNLTVENALDTRDIIVTKTWQDNEYPAGSDLHYDIAVTLTGTKSGSAALRWDDPADSTENDYSQTKVLAKDDKVVSGENAGKKYNLIFKGLPKYDSSGEAITYNITERLANGTDPLPASTDADRTIDVSSETPISAGTAFTPPTDPAHRKYGYTGSCNKREKTETVNGESKSYVEQYDLINTLPLTAVKVEKHWIDQSNEFGLRPADWHDFNSDNTAATDAVNIQLSRKSGTGSYTALAPTTAFRDKYSSEQTKTGDTWTYTYKKLLKYDEDNHEYSFRIVEKFPDSATHIPAYLAPQYCASGDFNESSPVNNKQELEGGDLSGGNLNGTVPLAKALEITNKLETRDIVVAVKWDDSNYTSRSYDSDHSDKTSSYINLRYNLKLTLQSDDLTVLTRKDSVTSTKYNEYQIIPKLIDSTETNGYGVTFYNLPVYKKDGTTVINYKVVQEVAADDAVSRAAKENCYSAPQSGKYDSSTSDTASSDKFEVSSKRYGYESEAKYDSSKAYLEQLNIKNTLPLNTINVSKHWSVDSKHRYYPDSERTVNYSVTRNVNDSDYEQGYKQTFSKPCSGGNTEDGTLTYQLVYDYANSPYTYTVTEERVKGYTTDYPEDPSSEAKDDSAQSKTAAKNTTMQLKIRNTMITGDVSFTKLDKDFYDTYNKDSYSFTAKTIPGATFRLHLGDGTVVNVTKVSDTVPYYVFDNSGTDTITSQSGGEIIIKGLPLNSYYLEELSVPSSYNIGTGTDHHDFDIDVNSSSSNTADKITYTDSQNIFNPEKPSTMTITKQGYDQNGDIQNFENATYLLLRLIPKNINKEAALSALGDDDYKSAAKASAENYLNDTSDLWRYWDNAGTYKTGADGTVRAENLMFGDYLFLEVQAPKGYKITRGIDIVTINETTVSAKTLTYPSGTPTMYDFGNIDHLDDQKPAYVEVEKTDEFGNGLNDAEFELYYSHHLSGDILVATVKTGDNGLNGFEDDGSGGNKKVVIKNSTYAELAADKKTIVLKKWGSYFFKETKPPVGYEITQEYYPFVIDRTKADMPLYIVTAMNTRKKGLVRLTKISSEVLGGNPAGKKLSGAEFNLYKYVDGTAAHDELIHITGPGVNQMYSYSADDSAPTTLTTSSATESVGTFSVGSLPWGKYYFKETTAPAGYALNTDNIYFTVGRNSPDTIEVGCADKIATAKLKITKNITELYDEWGNPTFIFKVKQTSAGLNNNRVRTISMTLDSAQKTVTSADIELEPGSYEVTEVSVARYGVSSVGFVKADGVTERTPSGSVQDTSVTQATFTVEAGGDVEVRFDNDVSYYDKFSHTESAVNKFNGVKGIEVSCIAPIDIGNKLATGTDLAYKELTKSDVLTAYLVKADGTKEALDPSEYKNLVIKEVDTGSVLDDSRFDISPSDSKNKETFTVMAEPIISAGYVYKLRASYEYKGHTFEKQFELTFKERAGITKKTVIFKADDDGRTHFDLDGKTASELRFTYYIMDGGIHAVTYNGTKLSGHSEAMKYVDKIRINAGYESTYEWGSPKWTTSSSIAFDNLETGIKSTAEDTLTYTISTQLQS